MGFLLRRTSKSVLMVQPELTDRAGATNGRFPLAPAGAGAVEDFRSSLARDHIEGQVGAAEARASRRSFLVRATGFAAAGVAGGALGPLVGGNDASVATGRVPLATAELTAEFAPFTGAVLSALLNGVDPRNSVGANTAALNELHASAAALGASIALPPGEILVGALKLQAPMFGASRTRTMLVASGTVTFGASDVELASLTVRSSCSSALEAANVSGVSLQDLNVEFEDSVTTSWLAINSYGVSRLRVIGCRFRTGGIQLSRCDDFLIDGNYWDCEYKNSNEPCHISGQSSGQFVNNTVCRTATDAVDLYSSGHYCVISNNRFLGLRGACGIECKVTMSNNLGNTSGPGNVVDGTIIANNVLRDFSPPATSTRVGIYAEYVDNRAVPMFSVTETNRAIIITGNVIEDMNVSNPPSGIIASYWGIAFTGHNGLITNNVIRRVRSWNSARPIGIRLAQPTGSKCVGVRVAGNVISGIENSVGIEVGSLERCQIDDNIIRQDDANGIATKIGVSLAAGAKVEDSSISGNVFELSSAASFGIRTLSSTALLSKTRVHGNTFRDCGVSVLVAQKCSFIGNIMDNSTNSEPFTVGVAGAACRGNLYSGNHVTMSGDYALCLIDHDGFVVTANTFDNTARALLLSGSTRNGIVDSNISLTQRLGREFPQYSGVNSTNQATISVGLNKVLV
ncbi:hypothetical protein E3O62_02790 [Cryobacterium sp. TMT2-15-1]|uniref:NosD domain-containing protein n=1 Tax=Cryobacterium sp. TMT2-15-1 TaxID=1259246 RepID=UPI001069C118|nr:NosD domain-containing protein [Cryobacterium sp. TMT2-15-1]TFC63501.1 hypothetical protein E3O62_02790 [Cryobacterium sp. TMT2-15-1]